MRKIYFLAIALIISIASHATIYQVNNNAGASADYSLLQDAINAATNGDTLYVAGSPNYYDGTGLIRLNKTLTIIGPGYFLGENGQTQSSNITANIYELEIGEGANNSVIMGLTFTANSFVLSRDQSNGNVGANGAFNVIIRRNLIKGLRVLYASGTLIEQNYFQNSNGYIYLAKTTSNTVVQNNIIVGNAAFVTEPSIYGDAGFALSNTIIRNNTLSENLSNINGVEIDNNIFISGYLEDCDNNTLKNNVFTVVKNSAIPSSSTGNTDLNNVFSATQANLFVSSTLTVDNDYLLKTASPAVGVGIGGIDAGAYGGANSYKLSGLPAIPSIYELTTNGIGTKENGLSVTVKAKSNN